MTDKVMTKEQWQEKYTSINDDAFMIVSIEKAGHRRYKVTTQSASGVVTQYVSEVPRRLLTRGRGLCGHQEPVTAE